MGDYTLLTSNSVDGLEGRIRLAAEDGWELYGSVSISAVYHPRSNDIYREYVQAMVKS